MKYFLLSLLLIPLVSADNITIITPEGIPIPRTHATVTFDTGLRTLVFVQEGIMRITPPQDAQVITAKLDSLDTLGLDWYFESSLPAPSTITVLPVGSVYGFVYDKDGKALPNSKVSVTCGAHYGDTKDRTTNTFGSFELDALPVGNCVISSTRGEYLGSTKVNITQGSLDDTVSVVLDQTVLSPSLRWIVISVILLILLSALLTGYHKFSGRKTTPTITPQNTRLDVVLPTLTKKEEEIVAFLLEHGESYQNRLVHELHIPKTTLVRLFSSLEVKKILTIEKIGKTKKVALSRWILGSNDVKD